MDVPQTLLDDYQTVEESQEAALETAELIDKNVHSRAAEKPARGPRNDVSRYTQCLPK